MNIKEYAEKIVSYLKKDLPEVELTVLTNTKNNGVVLTGICFKKGPGPAPVIYVDTCYEECVTAEEACKMILRQYNNVEELPNFGFASFEDTRDKIVFALVSDELNKDSKVAMVRIPSLKLRLIFKIIIREGMFATITNEILDKWGVDVYDVLEVAKSNTPRIFPPTCRNISEVPGMPCSDYETPDVNVLTNDSTLFGASTILYPGLLKKLSGGEDLLILPSSVHEVLILNKDRFCGETDFEEMVKFVNNEYVADDEILSYHVYMYNASTDQVEIYGEN